jgi:hypothetical protein
VAKKLGADLKSMGKSIKNVSAKPKAVIKPVKVTSRKSK